MKSKKLISAILAAASIAGGVVGAQAQTIDVLDHKVDTVINKLQDQENKIQGLENKVNSIDTTRQVEAEATARQDADQKLQVNINAEATARKDADTKLQKQIDKNGFKADAALKVAGNGAMQNGATNLTDGVNQNTRLVEAEAKARKDADTKLQTQIDTNKQQISKNQQNIGKNSSAIKTLQDNWKDSERAFNAEQVKQIDRNKDNIQFIHERMDMGAYKDGTFITNGDSIGEALKKLDTNAVDQQKQIDKNGIKADTALKVAGNGVLYNHATNLTDGVNENTKKIDANVKDIAANKTAIENEATARKDADTKLQNNINAEATIRENAVNALNSRIDQLGSDANKGIAKASALAALHPLDYDPDNKFDIAAAGGFYKGENAFALGAFYRPNRNVMLSMGTTLTDGDNAYNVGLTFKIGKSGKHTEAGLTTADLYAMIGAMQDKMDQQQKKIEELEAKQAK